MSGLLFLDVGAQDHLIDLFPEITAPFVGLEILLE
jgi:hypothetical protein